MLEVNIADQFTPLPIKTKTAGDVDVDIVSGTVGRIEGGSIVVTAGTTNVTTGSIVVTTGTIADMDTVGTVGRVEGGSILITAGTLTTGSLSNVATIGTIKNLDAGTVTVGNINNIGTLNVVEAGSINLLKAGTITKVEGGSILVTAGTITTGSLSNVATLGTIQNIVGGTVTVGNINNIGTLNVVETGSLNLLKAGTITKLEGGTLNNLATGTVTIGVGTVTTGSLSNVATVGTVLNINQGTITVSNPSGGPTSAKMDEGSQAALAAGATGTVAFTAITNAKTGQLDRVLVSSSVPIRAEIQSVDDPGTGTITAGVIFTSAAMLNDRFDPPFDTYFTRTSNGTAKFQAVIKNMDNSLSADIYAVGFWDEITT